MHDVPSQNIRPTTEDLDLWYAPPTNFVTRHREHKQYN